MSNIYDIKFMNKANVETSLKPYEGNVMLIVNTASKCGFTPQFEGLEDLHKRYNKKGVSIIGFPSDSFKQELKTQGKVNEFCKINYGVTFPIMGMVKVNGKETAPIFKELKKKKKAGTKRVWWNFEKFLVDQNGNVVKRFGSTVEPKDIEKFIIELLEK